VAKQVFDGVLKSKPNQVELLREDVRVSAKDLLDVRIPGGTITRAGVEGNVNVGLQYLESWLRGIGAAAIANLMEDTATAEIARSQVWQWVHHDVRLTDGTIVNRAFVQQMVEQELGKIRNSIGESAFDRGRFEDARDLFERVALSDDFVEFLTTPAYERID
jgi:malate synthase